jgi:hypothetical protein
MTVGAPTEPCDKETHLGLLGFLQLRPPLGLLRRLDGLRFGRWAELTLLALRSLQMDLSSI